MKMKRIFQKIEKRHPFKSDLNAITSDLIYSRILNPCSKLASGHSKKPFLEPPSYEEHDMYPALSVLAEEMDFIQAEAYKNSSLVFPKNNRILYYDCTNFFFEIEGADDFRGSGHDRKQYPGPAVQMGMFMDGDGIPVLINLFHDTANEHPTLKPAERKLIQEFGFDRFVVCTDAELYSFADQRCNDIGNKAFIVTQSLKQLKEDERALAIDGHDWRRLSDGMVVNDFARPERTLKNIPTRYFTKKFHMMRVRYRDSL